MLIIGVFFVGVSGFRVNVIVISGIFENIVNVNIVGYKWSFVYMIMLFVLNGEKDSLGVFFVVVL